jgi:hypothetical protein
MYESTRSKSGALSLRACSARSTTRSMFCLDLPGLTLTAGFPELRCLSRMTLGFRPPPGYGSGGWEFESLAARSIATGMLVGVQWRSARPDLGDSLDRVDNAGNHEPATWVGRPPGEARPEPAPLASEQRGDRWRSRVVTWAHSTAAGNCMATTVVVQAVQEDTCLPVGELRLQESGQGGAEPYSYLTLGRYSFPTTSRGPPHGYLASRWRRLRCDRRATPSAEPPTRPAARLERGVPARAGPRDRPVTARGP